MNENNNDSELEKLLQGIEKIEEAASWGGLKVKDRIVELKFNLNFHDLKSDVQFWDVVGVIQEEFIKRHEIPPRS